MGFCTEKEMQEFLHAVPLVERAVVAIAPRIPSTAPLLGRQ